LTSSSERSRYYRYFLCVLDYVLVGQKKAIGVNKKAGPVSVNFPLGITYCHEKAKQP
jgi:hypothetical protein